MSASLQTSLEHCVAVVLLDPEADVGLADVVFDDVVLQLARAAAHIEVMIDQFLLIDLHFVMPEQLQEIFRIIPAVADPPAAEYLATVEIEAVDAIGSIA